MEGKKVAIMGEGEVEVYSQKRRESAMCFTTCLFNIVKKYVLGYCFFVSSFPDCSLYKSPFTHLQLCTQTWKQITVAIPPHIDSLIL